MPLVIRVLSRDRSIDASALQATVSAQFKVDVPTHVLQTVLHRALKQGLVVTDDARKRWSLSPKGETYSDALESEVDVGRRLSFLLDDARRFFDQSGCPTTGDEIYQLICGIATENAAVLEQYMRPSDLVDSPSHSSTGTESREILLAYVRSAAPEHFRTLQDVIYGSLLISVVHSSDPTTLNELQDKRFRSTVVYLDTNYLLAVLGFENPNTVKPAKELYTLVREFGLHPRVFDFTLDELTRVLNRCVSEIDGGTVAVAGSQLSAELRRQGVTRSMLVRFIADMDDRLEELGIEKDITEVGDISKYIAKNKAIAEAVSSAKPEQSPAARNHDIAAVERIRANRRSSAHSIEDAGALLLTSDGRLAGCVHRDLGHGASGTVSEVVLDRLLTNLLWIKKPGWQFPLESVIAAHSHTLFVRRSVWTRFVDVLHEMKASGLVAEADITTLFYRDYIENAMSSDLDLQPEQIDPGFIERHLEAAKRLRETDVVAVKELSEAAAAQAAAAVADLDRAVEDARSEVEIEWIESVRSARQEASTAARQWAEAVYGWLSWVLIVLLAAMAWLSYAALSRQRVTGQVGIAATVVGLGVRLLAPKLGWRDKAVQRLSAIRYARLVRFLPEAPGDGSATGM